MRQKTTATKNNSNGNNNSKVSNKNFGFLSSSWPLGSVHPLLLKALCSLLPLAWLSLSPSAWIGLPPFGSALVWLDLTWHCSFWLPLVLFLIWFWLETPWLPPPSYYPLGFPLLCSPYLLRPSSGSTWIGSVTVVAWIFYKLPWIHLHVCLQSWISLEWIPTAWFQLIFLQLGLPELILIGSLHTIISSIKIFMNEKSMIDQIW